jgi:GMP synthase-like glutamine amidotransferase
MNLVNVIQHTSADYLGLLEDHLEGRRIRFSYFRPFTEQGTVPQANDVCDALFLMGGGPWGSAGVRDVPTLEQELRLTRNMLDQGKPVVGIGLGAQILAIASGGGSEPSPLEFRVGRARRLEDNALDGFMPESFPHVSYVRDRPLLAPGVRLLADDAAGHPAVFQVGKNALGFTGHPGFKTAMAEDLIMEFEESPENPTPLLERLQRMSREVEDALVPIMTGVIKITGLMQTRHRIPLELKS